MSYFLGADGWIFGLAIYTGNQTKIGCNKGIPPSKMTALERKINHFTLFTFIMQ
ncbi:hypothetical protein HGA89_04085, partial [bacterium]|nr:hypothetical protein [bacterium]